MDSDSTITAGKGGNAGVGGKVAGMSAPDGAPGISEDVYKIR